MKKDSGFKSYLKLLSKYVSQFKGRIAFGFSISLFFLVSSMATPFLTRFLLDKVLLGKNPNLLSQLLVIMIGVLFVFSAADIISNYILYVLFQKVGRNIRFDFFKKLQNFSTDFFSETRIGEITFRLFTDTQVIENSFSLMPLNFVMDILFVVAVGAIMLWWNLDLSIFVFAVFILQVIVIIKFKNPLYTYSRKCKEKGEEISAYAIEHFSTIDLVKVSNSEKMEQERFLTKLNQLIRLNIKNFLYNKFSNTSVGLINQVWSFGILWFGGIKTVKGELTIGTLMGFLLLAGMLFPPVSRLTTTILSFQDVRASIHRFNEFYEREYTIVEKEDAVVLDELKGHISLKDVSFSYTPGHLILNKINLEIKPGSIVVLVGKSGVGKTTLCRLLIRFYDTTGGKIEIDGYDIRDLNLDSYRSQIGISLQNQFALSGTIKENICYGSSGWTDDEIIEAAKKANAHEFIVHLPDGYNTEVGEKGVKLSGGEAQRLALARIFFKKPKIVIFDEPTSFVDILTEEKIKEAISRLKKEATVVIIAHRASTIQLADKIVVLKEGTIEEFSRGEMPSDEKYIHELLHKKI